MYFDSTFRCVLYCRKQSPSDAYTCRVYIFFVILFARWRINPNVHYDEDKTELYAYLGLAPYLRLKWRETWVPRVITIRQTTSGRRQNCAKCTDRLDYRSKYFQYTRRVQNMEQKLFNRYFVYFFIYFFYIINMHGKTKTQILTEKHLSLSAILLQWRNRDFFYEEWVSQNKPSLPL